MSQENYEISVSVTDVFKEVIFQSLINRYHKGRKKRRVLKKWARRAIRGGMSHNLWSKIWPMVESHPSYKLAFPGGEAWVVSATAAMNTVAQNVVGNEKEELSHTELEKENSGAVNAMQD